MKIQAHWKGHQARQAQKVPQHKLCWYRSRRTRVNEQEKDAAVKIQAHWKGHKVRKELEKKSESSEDESKANLEKAEKN